MNEASMLARPATIGGWPARINATRGGLAATGATKFVLTLAVASLFLERLMLVRGRRPGRDAAATETLALQFFIIGNFLLPPFSFWAGLRLAAQHEPEALEAAR